MEKQITKSKLQEMISEGVNKLHKVEVLKEQKANLEKELKELEKRKLSEGLDSE